MAKNPYENDERYGKTVDFFKAMGFNGHPGFYEALARMACTHADKNHDYSGSKDPLKNFRRCSRFLKPWLGTWVRITDKDSRFEEWMDRKLNGGEDMKVKDESVMDTLIDRANYTILLSLLLQEEIDAEANREKMCNSSTGSTCNCGGVQVTQVCGDPGYGLAGKLSDEDRRRLKVETINAISQSVECLTRKTAPVEYRYTDGRPPEKIELPI